MNEAEYLMKIYGGRGGILPNLVISNWLWGIMRVLLANQNWGNILNE